MRTARKAFTFVELLMGLVVMALVLGAVSVILSAVAQGWSDQEFSQSEQLQANQVYMRVQHILSGAKYVGQYNAGSVDGSSATPGSIFFWRADDCPTGLNDLTVQTDEVGLITLDYTTHTLWYYRAIPWASMTLSQQTRAAVVMHWSDLTDSTSPAAFQALDFVAGQALGGPGNQTDNGTRMHVIGAQFNCLSFSNNATSLPMIEFALGFTMNGQSLTLYNSTTLRAASTQPTP
jgi:type II secretory pathway pseudopilin PulG